MLLGQFLPWLLPVILIFGGGFLAYEGAHKVHERFFGDHTEAEEDVSPTGEFTPEHEQRTISQAIRTDFILSAEIMVIALKEVVSSDPDASIWMRAIVLAVVAVLITVLVYGVVAAIVKMDDVGLHLSRKSSAFSQRARARPGGRDAQAAGRHLVHRHPRHAVGGWPHLPGQPLRDRWAPTDCSRARPSVTPCTRRTT